MPRIKKIDSIIPKKRITKSTRKELTIPVYDLAGKESGSLELPKDIFRVEASPKLLSQYVRIYLANQRRGTASTKTRGDVVGSTRKIYRQKGTGRARHGDIKAPVFVGGGIVGGPKPRDFSRTMNKKQKRKALLYALTLKYKEKGLLGLSTDFLHIEAETKRMNEILKMLDLTNNKILLLLSKLEKSNLLLAVRNLPNMSVSDINSINPYIILKNQKIFILEDAVKLLSKFRINYEN